MKLNASVTAKDRGLLQWSRDVIALLKESGAHVKVGVLDDGGPGSEEREGGLSNAELAAVHEFGSSDGRVPERSFIRSTFEANRQKYVETLGELLGQVVLGKRTLEQAFNLVGLMMATDIKKRVAAGEIRQELKPATIARKEAKRARGNRGPLRALIDTGRLVASVTWAFFARGSTQRSRG